jgi:endonuclease/exonuclease/phosphatase (EEP) superfamily protein YafD
VLMMGDFNVSPWSIYYKNFASTMTWLDNITKNFTTLFTWNVSFLPFLQSHIDHIFVSKDIVIWDIEKVNTPGSDHRGYFIQNVR